MSDIKEEYSENKSNHAMKSSSEKFGDSDSSIALTPKKVFKPRFPYLWIFGRSGEGERADGGGELNDSDSSCQPYDDQVLKNGNFDTLANHLKYGIDHPRSDDLPFGKNDSPPLYYGVSLPRGTFSPEDGDEPLVFTDKKEALHAVKKYKGARFKAFPSEDDAVTFASQPADEICPTPTSQASPQIPGNEKPQGVMVEKPSPFRGPKSQEMVKLRRAIESGDEVYFKETVWSNPRYLISSCDTPAIMQEGFRYNGLHVAAKHKQPKMCQLIMQTIENPKFMELLYSEDSEESRTKRIDYVTDLYLNTPDKGLCETPLHFASKFGCLEAVEILAFHPSCDKRRKNKYGLEAREIICERCPSTSPELKKKIEDVFAEHYFVPVLRSDGNSVQPVIGEPYSPDNPRVPYSCGPVTNPVNPIDPSLSVVAVAGPMSPKDATDFYHLWKSPPSTMFIPQETSRLSRIHLSDTEKGLERIGRYLARSVKASWTEFWPSLNGWCDLSSHGGLQKLEDHLRNLYSQLNTRLQTQALEDKQASVKTPDSPNQLSDVLGASPLLSKTNNSNNLSSTSSGSSGISQLCHRLQDLQLSDSEDSLLKTSPDMPRVLKSHCDPFQQCESPLNSPHGDPFWKKIFHSSSSLNAGDSLIDEIPREPSLVLGNENVFCKNQLKFSTPKGGDSVNGHHHLEKGNIPKINVVNSDTPVVVKNVVQSILEVFSELLMNTEASVMPQTTLHKFLIDDVLPHIKCLHESTFLNDSEKRTVHCDIAVKVFKEIQDSFTYHEVRLITRHLTTYLESKFSDVSSDDEPANNRDRSLVKPKCLAISNNDVWKKLICILVFLYGFLPGAEHINNISITACQCKWESNGSSSKADIDEQVKSNKQNSGSELYPSSGDASDEEYATPPSSPQSSSCSSTPEEPSTPDEGLEIYVEGSFPSKADADVLRVVENVCVDPSCFPHIYRWKHLMSSFDKQVIESWPSPSRVGFHRSTVCNKSRTPCRVNPIFSSDGVCDSNEAFTPLRNRSGVRPLLRHIFKTESLYKKFLALEGKE